VLVEFQTQMERKVQHLYLVLSLQWVVVLGVMILALVALVALVVVLQTEAQVVRLHPVKVTLAGLAHQPALLLPQQAVVAAVLAQSAVMVLLVFLVSGALALHHL
jgi:hypothetical protein